MYDFSSFCFSRADLRIKCEEGSGSIDENGTDRKYYREALESSQRDRDINDRIPPPPQLEIVPSSPSGSGSSSTWNSGLTPKLEQPHKGVTTTTTPDGTRLFLYAWGKEALTRVGM